MTCSITYLYSFIRVRAVLFSLLLLPLSHTGLGEREREKCCLNKYLGTSFFLSVAYSQRRKILGGHTCRRTGKTSGFVKLPFLTISDQCSRISHLNSRTSPQRPAKGSCACWLNDAVCVKVSNEQPTLMSCGQREREKVEM